MKIRFYFAMVVLAICLNVSTSFAQNLTEAEKLEAVVESGHWKAQSITFGTDARAVFFHGQVEIAVRFVKTSDHLYAVVCEYATADDIVGSRFYKDCRNSVVNKIPFIIKDRRGLHIKIIKAY